MRLEKEKAGRRLPNDSRLVYVTIEGNPRHSNGGRARVLQGY